MALRLEAVEWPPEPMPLNEQGLPIGSHCGTGNPPDPFFPERELYFDERGYAAQLIVMRCMDCGVELVRYHQMRRLVKPRSRLSWRKDTGHRRFLDTLDGHGRRRRRLA